MLIAANCNKTNSLSHLDSSQINKVRQMIKVKIAFLVIFRYIRQQLLR